MLNLRLKSLINCCRCSLLTTKEAILILSFLWSLISWARMFDPMGTAPPLWRNGPTPGAFYNFPGTQITQTLPKEPITYSQWVNLKSLMICNLLVFHYWLIWHRTKTYDNLILSNNFLLCRSPVTTVTSVVALCYDKGVMIAGDLLASYGSLARYRNCSRIMEVNENIILGAGGDYADFQYIKGFIEQKM